MSAYYCEECGQEVEACSHWYQSDLEPLLRDVDVLGSPGPFWYLVGGFVLLASATWGIFRR